MYEPRTFSFPELDGISKETMDLHLGLYQGYVKHTNKIAELVADANLDPYAKAEARRRLAFEFDGMRNHEYFFEQFEGGSRALDPESALGREITETWGSFEAWQKNFTEVASTRGVGWAILYWDTKASKLLNVWCDEQQLGHLNSCQFIFGIDMWEHAYMRDYLPAAKGDYIQAVLSNTNWSVPESRLS